jgi:hypothetical protein
VDVGADLLGALFVPDERGEDGLDVSGVVLADLGAGLVHDEFPADEFGAWDGPGFDLVAYRAALEPDDRFELVAAVRGCGESEPSAAPGRSTQAANETAGRWGHSSTTTSP